MTKKMKLKKAKELFKMEEIQIEDNFITLNQLLKLTNLFDSGGFIKAYITEEGVYVNGTLEFRRGRKLYHNDVVKLKNNETLIVKSQETNANK
ncbi:RNA-binding S4 domain-containing protein [Pseudogracilibacillus sp. SO30301A]|uniref:RNA-binding S4 domain-containing protein n=1 Tax=Pseudogracilibacillus sp. SO30301A TaxID=3098291 RepID=UPI003FA7C3B8